MWILLLVALFHLSIYYCNIELFAKTPPIADDLNETKVKLEKYLNELKQYDSIEIDGRIDPVLSKNSH